MSAWRTLLAMLALQMCGVAPDPVVLDRVRGLERSGTNLLQTTLNQCRLTPSENSCHENGAFASFFRARHNDEPPADDLIGSPLHEHRRNVNPPRRQPGRLLQGSHSQGFPCWKHFRVQQDTTSAGLLGPKLPAHLQGLVHNLTSLDDLTSHPAHNKTYVVVVKSPVAWVESFCGWHLRCNVTDAATLRTLTAEWNGYVAKWFQLQDEQPSRVVLINYEHILINAHPALAPVIDSLAASDLPTSADCLDRVAVNLRDTGTFDGKHAPHIMMSHQEHWGSRRDYYLRCDYLKSLNAEQIRAVTSNIDRSLLARLDLHWQGDVPCLLPGSAAKEGRVRDRG